MLQIPYLDLFLAFVHTSNMSSRIADLSSTIAHHTALIDKYLAANQLSQPSFASDGPVTLGLTDELEQSRNVVVQATQELNELMIGPREIVFGHDVRFSKSC
jgi:hypothetical protein